MEREAGGAAQRLSLVRAHCIMLCGCGGQPLDDSRLDYRLCHIPSSPQQSFV